MEVCDDLGWPVGGSIQAGPASEWGRARHYLGLLDQGSRVSC